MGVLTEIARSFVSCKLRHRDWKKTDIYKGLNMYNTFKLSQSQTGGGKSLINIYLELKKLIKYWHCFPDTYFRFGMFLKDFGDMELMKTFVPQGAYYRYAADKDSQYHILLDDKILFHDVMRMYHLPVPERYFVFQAGVFRRNGNIIDDAEVDDIISKITD